MKIMLLDSIIFLNNISLMLWRTTITSNLKIET